MLTNCTFDGIVYDVGRVMGECLAIRPDLVFLWDEAWFAFASIHPVYRPRTAVRASRTPAERLRSPEYSAATRPPASGRSPGGYAMAGDPGYTLAGLAAQPRLAGARLHPHRCRLDIAVQRIVVRLGVSRAPASLLLDDFRDAVARFRRHAVAVSMTKGGIRRTQPPNAGSRLSRPLLTCSQCLAGLVRRFVKLLRLVSVSMRPGAGATVARPAIRRCVIGHATCVAAVSGGRQAPR